MRRRTMLTMMADSSWAKQILPIMSSELLLNGDFENSSLALPYTGWSSTVGDGAITDETTLIHGGGHAAKITAGASHSTILYMDIIAVPGDTYNLSLWACGDGVHGGRYYIYDVTHGFAILLSGTSDVGTSYVHATGSCVAPAGCVSIRVLLECPTTVGGIGYFDDISLLDGATEKIVNGGFEFGGFTGWAAQNGASFSTVNDPRTGSSGTKAISIVNSVTNYAFARQNLTLPLNTLLLMDGWEEASTGSTAPIIRVTGLTNFIEKSGSSTINVWSHKTQVGRVDQANPYFGLWGQSNVAGKEYRFDDMSLKSINFLSCLKNQKSTSTGDFIVRQCLRVTTGTWVGFCLNMDSATNPLNFVLAFVDGVNAYLETCLNGVYTRYSVASAWADDDEFKVTKTGTTYKLYRNNTQLGVDQTINQSAINNNTLHMQFSTYSGNQFTNRFTAMAYSVPQNITLTFLGDSITALAPSWADTAVGNYRRYDNINKIEHNYAAGGAGINYRSGYLDLNDEAVLAASDNANIIVIQLGTNDDNNGNMTTLQANAESGIAALKVSNPLATICWLNVLPRFDGPPYQDKTNVRAAIAAACLSQGIVCWDTFTNPWITDADTSDHLHLNATGKAKVAAQVVSRL